MQMFISSKLTVSLAALVVIATGTLPMIAQSPETAPPGTSAPSSPATATPVPASSALPDAPGASSGANQLPDAPGAAPTVLPAIEPTGPLVVFDTSMGRLTCRLFDKQSPIAAANFIGLATGTKEYTDPVTGKKMQGVPFYDGTTFHRVIPNFMIQGGDRKGDGTGDAGYYFEDEQTPGLNFDIAGRPARIRTGANSSSPRPLTRTWTASTQSSGSATHTLS
jgi:peptidyl-prolyl cis-trans isomerase A (cyclophilin A)